MLTENERRSLTLSLRVAELAQAAKVTPATVRHYARTGLLHPGRDTDNGYRLFSSSDVRRTVFIRQAQTLGLTLEDIKTILDEVDDGRIPCHQVKSLVESRLDAIKSRIAELKETECRITTAISMWNDTDDWRPSGKELCPLIERLTPTESTAYSV